jgi:amino acid adenylation domain-containing protein
MKEYWIKVLSGDLAKSTLPIFDLSKPKVEVEERTTKAVEYHIPGDLNDRIMTICKHSEMAFFVFLAAALNALLYRYSQNESIIIGTAIFKIKEGNGPNDILILKNSVSGDLSFKELLAGVKQVVMDAYKYQEYPFEEIEAWLRTNRKLDFKDILNIAFISEPVQAQPGRLKEFDLVIRYSQRDQRNRLCWEYNRDIYHDTIVQQFGSHFINFLTHVPEDLEGSIEEVDILSEGDRQTLLHSFNETELKYDRAMGRYDRNKTRTIHELFEAQAARTPDPTAVIGMAAAVTYRELNEKCNRLARKLREKGVKPWTIVALMLEPSLEMVIGMLAVLKSGGAYLPIDPGYPAKRQQYMLRDSCASLLLVHRHWVEQEQNKEVLRDFTVETGHRLIIIDEDSLYPGESSNPGMVNRPGDPAYINYTSGTTGNPRGVVVSHGNVTAYLDSFFNEFVIGPGDTVLQQASYSFDVIVEELYPVLLRGGKLAIPGDEEMADIDLLVEFMVDRDVTFITCSPIMLSELNKRLLPYKDRLHIHTFISGGDVLRKGYIDNLLEIGNVYNTYGPTETTVCATYYRCAAVKGIPASIPIGKPILNSRVYIVEARSGLVPIGAAGELCISGEGVSMGYLNQPELTKEKFRIPNKKQNTFNEKFLRGSRGQFLQKEPPGRRRQKLYKTGDLARWLPDGNIEFLGRLDRQVKVRGYRVELEEIEKRLVQHALVGEAVVVVRENERGGKYLCAYIVPGSQEDVDVSLLREALAVNLPDYMIPPYIMTLERIPLTAHGKADRRALPAPAAEGGGIYTAPRNREEMKLVEIWSELLRTEQGRIGIDSNFFRLGGHSLTATQLVYRVHKDMGVDLELRDVFIHPTVSELARKIKSSEFLEYVKINNIEEREYYDLSYAQRRLWVLCQFEEDSTAYNMPGAFIMCGNIDVEVFKKAFQALAGRHEGLSTVFITANGEPKQKIIKDFRVEVDEIDFRDRNLNPGAIEEEGRKIFREAANWAFDLEQGPLVLFRLVRLEEQEYLFITNFHHIINDAWSQGMMNNEVVELYNAFLEDKEHSLPPLELQYKDYTYWHNELIEGGGFADVGKYWLEKFKDKPNGIELPRDRPRRPVQTFNGRRIHFSIPEENKQRLYSLCLSHDSTLFMGLLTLVAIFMYRYTGQADIIVGSPIAGRRRKELQGIVGFLVNTLVYRNEVDPSDCFGTLLKKVREETLACYGNQDYPFDLLVDQLELQRDLSQSPLFNVMLAHNNADIQEIELVMKGVEISGFPYDDFNMSKFDLIFFMDEIGEEIYIRLEYNSDLFEGGTAERMAANFSVLTGSVLAHPDQPLYSLDYIHPREYETIVNRFNDNREEFPRLTVRELFEQQAAKTPEQTAVVTDTVHITYRELNRKANRLAHYLREEFSVTRGDIVGISIDRSIEMIIAILGIIKSGAGYLAIDPTYPGERVLHMLADSRCHLVIIDRAGPHLFRNYRGKQINIYSGWEDIAAKSGENPPVVNDASDVLYVIYTSGSTGTPNGAMLSHGILSNLVQWQHHKTTIDCSLRCLQFTSVNFCVSFQEIIITLTAGGSVHLIGEIERQDIDYLMDFLVEQRIRVLYLPFSYLNFLFNESGRWRQSFNHCLKHIITAGEQLKITAGLKRFLEENPGVQLHNHYGSSEMHVVTSYTLDASSASSVPVPPAGRPVSNTAIYILDEYDKPVPIGVWGELCIAGSLEVLGYIHNPVLTNRKLFSHPLFSKNNKRLYRSGDLGRWLEDGNIELKGRKDFQVKIRGFRVEPGEIESKILAVEGVGDCVVEVKESSAGKDQTGTPGQKYLVGYVVLEKKGANRSELDNIYRGLSRSLPQYMIPRLMVLDRLPLMPNGKVDKEKLPEPEFHAEEEYTAPRNETEARLAQIWSELLGIEPGSISVDANFFALGGHSLKATKMMAEIHKAFHVRIPLTEIFQSPVIKDLSGFISGAAEDRYASIEPLEEKEYYILSSAQKRLYYLQQLVPGSTAYNMPYMEVLDEETGRNREKLEHTFRKLIGRHESLRTSFHIVRDKPVQEVRESVDFAIEYYTAGIGRDFVRPFDLTMAPLLRVGLINTGGRGFTLIVDMHHIISDGISHFVLVNDFLALYREEELPSLRLQYKDFSGWQNREKNKEAVKAQAEYWQKQFEGEIPVLNLPFDYPRPEIQRFAGDSITFELSKEETDVLNRLVLEEGVTLYMVLLALYAILLSEITGQEDIVAGTPVGGRRHADLYRIIGMFVNTLPIRLRLLPGKTFKEFLKCVKETTVEAFENQDCQFEDIVECVVKTRDVGRNPLFDVMFALQGPDIQVPGRGTADPGTSRDNLEAKFDLTLTAIEAGKEESLSFTLDYNARLFKPETAERFVNYFKEIAAAVVENPMIRLEDIKISHDLFNEDLQVPRMEIEF